MIHTTTSGREIVPLYLVAISREEDLISVKAEGLVTFMLMDHASYSPLHLSIFQSL